MSDQLCDPSGTLHTNLNQQAAIIIQIESLEGIKNLDAILTECGDQIDSVWLGSLDARISMDLQGGGILGAEKEWQDAVATFESTLAKHNMPASGLAFGPPEMKAILSKGRSMIFGSADMMALMSACGELQQIRQEYPAKDHSKIFKQI
jgi:4-hydroxy-2-oxoheptanedioate aldolase